MIDAPAPAATATTPGTPKVPAPVRKPNKLMADLTRAMQAAAEQARTDAIARLTGDSKAFIETIHSTSATEATDLRRHADDDVAAIREWSKAEIARIREETEERISGRKGHLEREIEQHAAAVARRIERVQARVSAFEAEMAAFFERLTAEQDPTRLAAMAESLPEPPSFDAEMDGEDIPLPVTLVADPAVEAAPEVVDAPVDTSAITDTIATATDDLFSIVGDEAPAEADPRLAALGFDAAAAAEAEAASFGDAEAPTDDDIPTITDDALATRLAGLVPDSEAAGDTLTTRVVVVGLVSVASIAGFKRNLSRVPGVDSVGVSSGPDGEFVFAVVRGRATDLSAAIVALPGFAARVTDESDGDLHVTARDPEHEG